MKTPIIAIPLIIRLFLYLGISVATAFSQTTEIPKSNREADADYQKEREAWINQMHRAEPGLSWQAIDAQTRNAKFEALQHTQDKHSYTALGLSHDTLAGGRIIGSWSERGSNNICGRMLTADIDFDHNTIYAASAMGNIWKAGS